MPQHCLEVPKRKKKDEPKKEKAKTAFQQRIDELQKKDEVAKGIVKEKPAEKKKLYGRAALEAQQKKTPKFVKPKVPKKSLKDLP